MSNKLANNFSILSSKLVVVFLLSLLTTRAVLDNLGVEDYGIYALLVGVVGLLGILNAAMTTSTQRFIAIELGRMDIAAASYQFNQSFVLHLVVVIVIFCLGLGFLQLLLNQFLIIPNERLDEAKIVYISVLLILAVNIISVPFYAVLYTNERMDIISLLEICRSLMGLLVAHSLYLVSGDKLVWYSIGYSSCFLIFLVVVWFVTYSKFKEFRLKLSQMKRVSGLKRVLSFSFWNLFGAIASIAQNQGLAVMLNLFYGPSINAALGVSQQVFAQMSSLSATIMKSVIPQMIKNEGSGDRQALRSLSLLSSKYSFFLLLIVSVPFLYDPRFVLSLWLVEVPDLADQFTRLIVIMVLVNQATVSLMASIQAVGKIAFYQFVVGSILISALPFSYYYLEFGLPVESVLIIYVVIAAIAGVVRVLFAKKLIGIGIKDWLKQVVFPILIVVSGVVFLMILAAYNFFNTIGHVYTMLFSVFLSFLIVFVVGLKKIERTFLYDYVFNLLGRIIKKFKGK